MTQALDEPSDRFRVGDKGIEAVPAGGAAKAGFGDKKKVAILAVLFLVGTSVAAYQFLGGDGPKQAVADWAPSRAGAPTGVSVNASSVESVLKRIDVGPQAADSGALSVDRVEEIVNTFDTYVQSRQVPLHRLRVNPFAVVPDEAEQRKAEEETQTDEEAEAEARRAQMLEAARALKVGSILIVGGGRKAIVGGKLCAVGDTIQGLCVHAIDPGCVTLSFEGETVELRLRPETGGG
jgi:hypothetical protein